MPSIVVSLAELLASVRRPGDFFVSGRTELMAPRLEVAGVGPIALPILPIQAKQLIAAAKRAPFGRGAETVVDTSVRRTWQIEAAQVQIGGRHWDKTIDTLLARVTEGLGLDEPISAELYKLLVYDKGSFFVSHRDTEKAPGMFATLVLALPSRSAGGDLVVRHGGREVALDLRCEEPSEIAFAAFFADCVHEVLPVTSGCRVTLVYNLLRKGKGAAPKAPDHSAELTKAAAMLDQWALNGSNTAEQYPLKLIYPLEHAYTPAELGFGTLKGADAAAAKLLASAAPLAGCDLHLALLSIEESGAAEYSGSYQSRYRAEQDSDDFEAGEVFDRSEKLSDWRRPDGDPSTLDWLPVLEGELSPPDVLADLEPDEEHFHEATGNEGASFERSYRRAALVLWPGARFLAVLNQAGLPVTLPHLDRLAAAADGHDGNSSAWQQAHELAGHMIATWPAHSWHPRPDRGETDTARMLAALTRLKDREHIAAMIAGVIARGGHERSDCGAISDALALFPPEQATDVLGRIVSGSAEAALGACAALLARAASGRFAGKPAKLKAPVRLLVEALPGEPKRNPEAEIRRHRTGVDAALIADLVSVVDAVDADLARRSAAHCLAWPKIYGLDAVLVPALRKLASAKANKQTAGRPAFERLRAACLAHLRARAAEPLEPPPDWTRDADVRCQCAHCSALSRFLADPAAGTWTLKAAEPIRRHVADQIRAAACDLTTTTERRGSPHGLVCTKTDASYRRRVVQRKQDLGDIDVLG